MARTRARRLFFESPSRSKLCLEHDLFRKPVPTFRDHALETEAWPPEGVAPEVAAEAPGLERRGVPADEQAGPLAHDLLAHVIERAPRPGGVAPPGRLLLLAARLVGLPLNRFLDRLVDRFLHRLLDWRVDGARCELVVRTGAGGDRLLGRRLDRRDGRDPARRGAIIPCRLEGDARLRGDAGFGRIEMHGVARGAGHEGEVLDQRRRYQRHLLAVGRTGHADPGVVEHDLGIPAGRVDPLQEVAYKQAE